MEILHKSDEFEVLIGDDAATLFEYYNVSEMHGLNFRDCVKRMKEGETYIDGLCNFVPVYNNPCHYDYSKWFVFFNLQAFQRNHKDNGLVMHEFTHAGFINYVWEVEREEEIIQYGQDMYNKFYPEIRRYVNYRYYQSQKMVE